jgi:hypothetical protein
MKLHELINPKFNFEFMKVSRHKYFGKFSSLRNYIRSAYRVNTADIGLQYSKIYFLMANFIGKSFRNNRL